MNIKNNNKKILFAILLAGLFFGVFHFQITFAADAIPQSSNFQYKMLETLPGFFAQNSVVDDLPTFILAIYKFGIWTVGIAGLFMLVVGGFVYMTSAGNNAAVSSAKEIIRDALLGIVAAMAAYLVMYVINPDLTSINIAFTKASVKDLPIGVGGGGGKCEPVTKAGKSGTVEQLGSSFGVNAAKASSICKVESGGDAGLASTVDLCSDLKPFSIGLFQINMIDSATSIGCNADGEIFTTGKSKGTCIKKNPKNGICMMWSCAVRDVAKYDMCVARLKDPTTNINIAKQLSNGGTSWGRWGANGICQF